MNACNPLLTQRERAAADARAYAAQQNNSLRAEKDRYETDIPKKSLYAMVRRSNRQPSLS